MGVEWLMFADDILLVGDSKEKLERLVQEFSNVCRRWKLTVNEGKSKVMRIGKNGEEDEVNISLNGRRMEEVGIYRYLGVDISNEVGMYEGIIEPSLLYGCETWALNKKDRKRMEAVE